MSGSPGRAFDTAVVGAGPAGSHAAGLLARVGLRVALLDRAEFPRDKTCGGGLSQKSLALLPDLPEDLVQRRFGGAWITWRDEAAIVKDFSGEQACTVLRSELDNWLMQRARAAGAFFFPGTRVTRTAVDADGVRLETSRGIFAARLLLAADGVGSVIRNQVFGRDAVSYAPAIEVLLPQAAASSDVPGERVVFDLGGMPRGYGWIFPKRDHLNVGVYSPFGGTGIRRHLATFLAMHGLDRHAVAAPPCGYAIPVRNRLRRYEKGPVLLLGDAAGLADALWGEGICFALQSAALAARAVLTSGGAPPAGAYDMLMHAHVAGELAWSLRLSRLLYRMGRSAFDPLARNHWTCDWFAGVITGEVSYAQCFWRTLLGAPAWVFAGRHEVQALPWLQPAGEAGHAAMSAS